jgi:hypothetical protein
MYSVHLGGTAIISLSRCVSTKAICGDSQIGHKTNLRIYHSVNIYHSANEHDLS